jgi:hypothetical protein
MQETVQYFAKKVFFFNRSQIFIALSQNFMPHIEIMKFCQNHWSLLLMVLGMHTIIRRTSLLGDASNQRVSQGAGP